MGINLGINARRGGISLVGKAHLSAKIVRVLWTVVIPSLDHSKRKKPGSQIFQMVLDPFLGHALFSISAQYEIPYLGLGRSYRLGF